MGIDIIRRNKKLYIALFSLFTLSFNFNILGVGLNDGWFAGFDPTSENMTHRTMQCAAEGAHKGGLVNINEGPTIQEYCKVYPSQFGMQGFVYGAVGGVLKSPTQQKYAIEALQLLLAASMSVVLLLFVRFVHHVKNKRVALLTAAMLALSVWIVGFANQMYWVSFTFFVPFVAALYLYPWARKTAKNYRYFCLILFGLFLLKFLNGYEYLGAVTISVVTAMVYWEYSQTKVRPNVSVLIRRAAWIIGVGAAAFVIALMLNLGSMIDDYGSLSKSLEAVKGRGEARSITEVRQSFPTAVYNFIDMNPEVYQLVDSHKDIDVLYANEASAFVYVGVLFASYMLAPVITLPIEFNGLINVVLESFAFWAILGFALVFSIKSRKLLHGFEAAAFKINLVLSLLGILSWFVLVTEHTVVHAHMVPISYYMPFMLWVFMIAAISIDASLSSRTRRLR